MKLVLFGFAFVASCFICSGQAFRSGFYKREHGPGGGSGQGASYQSNIGSSLHNNGSFFLIGDLDSMIGKPKKRWSFYFGVGVNWRFPKVTFENHVFKIRPGIDAIFMMPVYKTFKVAIGVSYNIYTYWTKSLNGLGQYNEHSLTNRIIGIPVLCEVDFFSDKKVYPSLQGGFILNYLLYSNSSVFYSNGVESSETEYDKGSGAAFFTGSLKLNFSFHKELTYLLSLDYFQQNKSFQKIGPDPPNDFAKIFRLNVGLKVLL